MSAHTPGEWLSHVDAAHHRVVVRVGMTPIAEMWMTGQPQAEREANARLIAAAPDLLGALYAVDHASEYMDFDPESRFGLAMQKVAEAIARATGEQP